MSSQNSKGNVTHLVAERIYRNAGNIPLIELLEKRCNKLLDIGCGADDNAVLVNSTYTECGVYGITYSNSEADLAEKMMEKYWVFDIKNQFPSDLENYHFDCLFFSHVLEHLSDRAEVLARFARPLRKGGKC